ncbi:unnamed protein product [Owenia fusiformis]|uniref:Uncharacterized protein n=1 Tax=Owenia fusiformis TaxID=6347 RepID=A0A8J1UUU6_OWEFU|nr:unnamed protein product [Owenia fusiformis]
MITTAVTFDTSEKYQDTHPGYARLTEFVNITSSKVDIFNRYKHEELENHTRYITDFAESICTGFGEYNEQFKTKGLIPRGSYFEKTKIVSPKEYDFLPVLALSDDASVEVCDVPEDNALAGKGYGMVKIHPGSLQNRLYSDSIKYCSSVPDSSLFMFVIDHLPHPEHSTNGSLGKVCCLSTCIANHLHDDINSYLKTTYGSMYLGKKNHKEEKNPCYTLGSFSLHVDLHGPSVWLQLGGPLGTTDIDLCFCIANEPGCVMVPTFLQDDMYWAKSIVQTQYPATNHNLYTYVPTENHRQLFLLMKYISHMCDKIQWHLYHKHPHLISSYSYKLMVMKHQQSCTGSDSNVGKCFEDVVEYIFNQFRQEGNASNQYMLPIWNKTIKLPDTYYPNREVSIASSGYNKGELLILLWVLKYVKHTRDTHWWDQLMDDDFPNNVKPGDVSNSLLDTFKRMHYTGLLLELTGEPNNQINWQHEDGIQTQLLFTD